MDCSQMKTKLIKQCHPLIVQNYHYTLGNYADRK